MTTQLLMANYKRQRKYLRQLQNRLRKRSHNIIQTLIPTFPIKFFV